MLTKREKDINNAFQILEDLKAFEIKRSLYQPPKILRLSLKAQPSGKVKIFNEEEIFLFKIRRYSKRRKEMFNLCKLLR